MIDADLLYSRSIVRIPVASQAENIPGRLPANNTLIFIRAWLPEKNKAGDDAPGGFQSFSGGIDDSNDVIRPTLSFDTLYGIDGYLHEHAKEYRENSQISVTAFLSTIDADDDETGFVCAVDNVSAEILDKGQLKVTVALAEQESTHAVEISMAVYVSVWLQTYEPQPDFLSQSFGTRSLTNLVKSTEFP
jgi:hypothetical protein